MMWAHYLKTYPSESEHRLLRFVVDELHQTVTSPLAILARFIDSNDGALLGSYVCGDSMKDRNVTFMLFFNLKMALEYCVLESSSHAQKLFANYWANDIAAKLVSFGVVGPASAAVFLINLRYDHSWRTSILAMWPEPLSHSLFEHGLRVEGLDVPIQEYYGFDKHMGFDSLLLPSGQSVSADEILFQNESLLFLDQRLFAWICSTSIIHLLVAYKYM